MENEYEYEGRDGDHRRSFSKRKGCRFCVDKDSAIDWKDVVLLSNFITDRGKIVPGRVSGVCSLHQRAVAMAIKRARQMALLSYVDGFTASGDEAGTP